MISCLWEAINWLVCFNWIAKSLSEEGSLMMIPFISPCKDLIDNFGLLLYQLRFFHFFFSFFFFFFIWFRRLEYEFALAFCGCSKFSKCHVSPCGWLGMDRAYIDGVVEPKTPNQAFGACLMADGALPLICCYVGPLWGKYGFAVKAFCLRWKPSFNKITTADTLLSNKMITAESKRKHRKTA